MNEMKSLWVWVCLFTWVTVRAIRLEVVEDLPAEEFLPVLQRLITRQGTPKEIILDDASQFKLAKPTASIAWETTIHDPTMQSYIDEERFKGNFIVKLLSWMGGFYKRLLGNSKNGFTQVNWKDMFNHVIATDISGRD